MIGQLGSGGPAPLRALSAHRWSASSKPAGRAGVVPARPPPAARGRRRSDRQLIGARRQETTHQTEQISGYRPKVSTCARTEELRNFPEPVPDAQWRFRAVRVCLAEYRAAANPARILVLDWTLRKATKPWLFL